jgi:hypothetical protein
MTNVAIAIGVNQTGGLPRLAGAVAGAERFATWARGQGMQVILMTDKETPVLVSTIQDEIDAILDARNCKKLVVFFAGHGFLLAPQVELWLLSRAPDRDQEAVNVQLSRDHARYSGIEHVIFVSDACRSGGPTHRHRSVRGSSIFRPPASYDFDGKLDTFYATRPGDTALEYKDGQEAVDNYKGLFTECLLNALKGDEADVVREYDDVAGKRWLILSELLEDHLEEVVPLRAEAIDIKLSQSPIIIPESRAPQCFGELAQAPTSAGGTVFRDDAEPVMSRAVARVQEEVMSFHPATDALTRDQPGALYQAFVGQVDQIASSSGRDHYETETGFSIYGRLRSALAGGGWNLEDFSDNDVTHVRVFPEDGTAGHSILLEFDSGLGTVLAIKPGFIGTVVLDDDQVVNVNYTPSSNTSLYHEEYADAAARIERRRAFAAAATRHGVFAIKVDEAHAAGGYLRMMKRLDPTLGLYAAYAYHQAGNRREVLSIVEYMAHDGLVPFDVLLLARVPEPWPAFAPFCPMLRQGWALLELHPPAVERLSGFRSYLLPSLWTMLSKTGVDRVRQALEAGEVR